MAQVGSARRDVARGIKIKGKRRRKTLHEASKKKRCSRRDRLPSDSQSISLGLFSPALSRSATPFLDAFSPLTEQGENNRKSLQSKLT